LLTIGKVRYQLAILGVTFGVTEDARMELPRRTVFGAGKMAGKKRVVTAAWGFPDLGFDFARPQKMTVICDDVPRTLKHSAGQRNDRYSS
jgi:hypothetical protein